ncbi:putative NBD/HSP70 family sugar kinase [Streptosporangium becharense]|uniref:Putative NBD/HSP70 family sugar kinase n=1 Tax=Streptosporangium becharense TaxID=1816182 RepID=A0A7W9ICM9_9ACTN|nr:ROK family transcriptional regulator [Streptosporangium becharense]MBB2913710.1 putative NBD/HSP70 family sugar kinase [Streptosporangium becharense]MBB5817791.1 putative NBD/HSP70 family sugar kinase [Streptosporangium becharense]
MNQPVPGTPSLLRAINDRAALQALLERGPLTRPEIGTLTGLSKPTASQLLARLQEAGLVVLDGIREGLPGRTAEVYRLNPAAAYVAALDVTPTHIDARVADITGAVVGEHRLPTPGRSSGDVVGRVRAALDGAGAPPGLRHAVIGVQAALDPRTGRLGYATAKDMPGWHIPDLVRTLADGLGVRIAIENNVNLVAQAEQAHGVGRGHRDFVLLWADEGLGSALVLGGRLHRGATGGAGEVGYMPTPGAPTAREAGRYGHHGYQALTGGTAVVKILRSYGVRATTPVQAVCNAVETAAGTGRRADDARAGLRDVAGRLAVGLAAITSVVDPGIIVLTGGTLLAGGDTLRELVEHELHALTIPRPPVLLSTVEGNPVLAGALDLALATTREEVFGSTVLS